MGISTVQNAGKAAASAAVSLDILSSGLGAPTPAAGATGTTGIAGAAGGEGLDGLDSFNQLLGNFLSLTGIENVAGDNTATGLVSGQEADAPDGAITGATSGIALPTGLGALLSGGLKGLQISPQAGANAVKGLEARWAQSGINLLSGGNLSGQEIDQELVSFLNDLSSALSGTPVDGEPAAGDGKGDASEIDLLSALQGSAATGGITIEQLTQQLALAGNGPVIPVTAKDGTPSALGVNLTVTGTGLKALPSLPDAATAAIPAPQASPVIPKLDNVGPNGIAAPVTTGANQKAAAGTTLPEAPAAAPAVPVVETTVAGDAASPNGAITLPADLVATAITDDTAVNAEAIKLAAPSGKATATPVATAGTDKVIPATPAAPAKASAATPPPPVKAAPVAAQTDVTAAPTPATSASPQAAATSPTASPAASSAASSAPGDDTVTLTVAQTIATPKVAATADKATTEATGAPAKDATPIDTPTDASAEPGTTAAAADKPESGNAAGHTAGSRTPAAARDAAKPVTAAQQTAEPDAADETDAKAADDIDLDDDSVTNRRFLAPRHVSTEAKAEQRNDLAEQAQAAAQVQTAVRPQTVTPRAAVEDNLLTGAIIATAKDHEGGSSTDGERRDGSTSFALAEPATATESSETSSFSLATGDVGPRLPGADFTQSLRQAGAPHRPTAYPPPGTQVAFQVQRAVEDGNDRVSIQLNPHDLGRIDVHLEIGSEGKLRAKVLVENPHTLELLQKDAKNLEKALQDVGVQTDQNSLSFSLQDNGDQAQQQQQSQQGSDQYGTNFASADVEEQDPAIIAQTQLLELGRVDVRV